MPGFAKSRYDIFVGASIFRNDATKICKVVYIFDGFTIEYDGCCIMRVYSQWLVLLVLISRPVDFAVTYKADVFCCMCWNWRDKIAFVKVRLFHFLPGVWGNHYLNKSLSIRSLSEVYVKYCDVVLATWWQNVQKCFLKNIYS